MPLEARPFDPPRRRSRTRRAQAAERGDAGPADPGPEPATRLIRALVQALWGPARPASLERQTDVPLPRLARALVRAIARSGHRTVARDLTEALDAIARQRRVERELRRRLQALAERHAQLAEEHAQLAAALQAAELMVFTWDPVADRVERRLSRIGPLPTTTGAEADEGPRTFRSVLELVHPDDREQFAAVVHRSLAGQGPGRYSIRYRVGEPSRPPLVLEEHALVQFDGAGAPSRVVGVTQDVTQADQADRHRRALLDIATLVLNGSLAEVRSLQAILAEVQRALDTRVLVFLRRVEGRYAVEGVEAAPDVPASTLQALAETVARWCEGSGGGPARVGSAFDGHPLLREAGLRAHLCSTFRGPADAPAGALFAGCADRDAFTDAEADFLDGVGQLLQIARRRHEDEEALRQADRRKDDFLATLAHEVRNPLGAISNGLTLLRSDPSPATAHKVHAMVGRQLGHAVRLIDDLLDLSRIRAGKFTLETRRVALLETIHTAIDAARNAIDTKRHALQVDLPGRTLWVEADPARLCQAFANLLTNAARYTPRGGNIRVQIRDADGEWVQVDVTDDGVGLSPEHLDAIFTMYMQAPADRVAHDGGLGIGLALVRSVVELHGGEVSVRSDGPGRGSTFSIRLPLAAEPPPAPSAPVSPVPDIQPAPLGQRILIVDDNADAAVTLALLLRAEGYVVRTAGDGKSCLAAARAFEPQLIVLDIGLPGEDGHAIAARLRADPATRGIRLVALTGHGSADDRSHAMDSGFDAYLVKPTEFEKLHALLGELLR